MMEQFECGWQITMIFAERLVGWTAYERRFDARRVEAWRVEVKV